MEQRDAASQQRWPHVSLLVAFLQVAQRQVGVCGRSGCICSRNFDSGAAGQCLHLRPGPVLCAADHHAHLHDGAPA